MSAEIILIILSSVVILSYLFDLVARQFRIPSVLLLLFSGIGLRYLTTAFEITLPNLQPLLPVVGTVGLILIVLEGALELKLEKDKRKLITSAFYSAGVILILTSAAIALFLSYWSGQSFHQCFINTIPLGIISSAIAIPSASVLTEAKKDFIIYESSLSDILGIIIFNFMLANEVITFGSFVTLGYQTIFIILLSGAFCLILLYFLKRITHHLKFFLILAVLIFVYAIGKHYHLPTLVIVLAFGLFMNNLHWNRSEWFNKTFQYDGFGKDLHLLSQISGESAFIVRTFFFLMFGYYLNIITLLDSEVIKVGIVVVVLIYLIRIVYQKTFIRQISWAEILISPRGLISILLFFGIPEAKRLSEVSDGLLFFVILATSIIMTLGLITSHEKKF